MSKANIKCDCLNRCFSSANTFIESQKKSIKRLTIKEYKSRTAN